MPVHKRAIPLFFVLLTGCWIPTARADVGPKPRIKIELPSSLHEKVETGVLLLCQDATCGEAKPLEDNGPQAFRCHTTSKKNTENTGYFAASLAKGQCGGLAYGFAPYLQLNITLKTGEKMKSAVFTKKKFNAVYKAILDGKDLMLTEQP